MIDVDIVGQLVPNPVTMITQLCSTLVLFLLAKKFLWKYVQRFLDARSDKMQADLADSEKAKQDALSDRKKAQEELSQASGKAQDIIDAAVKEGNSEKESILAQASQEASAERQKAHRQIEQERSQMYDSLKKDMVDVAMAATNKLISSKSDETMDREAVEAFVKEAAAHEQ